MPESLLCPWSSDVFINASDFGANLEHHWTAARLTCTGSPYGTGILTHIYPHISKIVFCLNCNLPFFTFSDCSHLQILKIVHIGFGFQLPLKNLQMWRIWAIYKFEVVLTTTRYHCNLPRPSPKDIPYQYQLQFQDPRMEVVYHIRWYFGRIFPYIALKHRPYMILYVC